jgi:hypothetical protein
MSFEQEQEAAYARAVEKSKRTGKPMEIDARGRPVLPRWPLVTGIVPFLLSRGVPVRWLALAVSLFGGGAILFSGLAAAGSGGFGAFYGVVFVAIGSILTVIIAAAALSFFLTIVTESSEGNRETENWPPVHDWFADALLVAVAAMVSGMPGWAIANFAVSQPLHQAAAVAAGIVASFPVILLSQLEIGSPWAILSPAVLKSLLRCPFSWLTFYVETTALIGGCLAAAAFVGNSGWNPLVVLAPLGTAALFLYARLLGRLGWRLAETA